MYQGSEGSDALAHAFAQATLPVYLIDGKGRILYANLALEEWLEVPLVQLMGRQTSYHGNTSASKLEAAVMGLAPPPSAFDGKGGKGTISCVGKEGGLRHRHANFVPLLPGAEESPLLVMLEPRDLTSEELAATLSPTAPPDRFHVALAEWRRTHFASYSGSALLGISPAIRRVADQVRAAAVSLQNVLVTGPAAADLRGVAETIHYLTNPANQGELLRVEPGLAFPDELRRALKSGTAARGTLLIVGVNDLSPQEQQDIAAQIAQPAFKWRVVATMSGGDSPPLLPALLSALSTFEIRLPPLSERLDDLPLLAQWYVEQLNAKSSKHLEGFSSDALERMSLYDWPGEQEELYQVVAAAHARASGPWIEGSDLPPLIRHAVSHAQHLRNEVEPIDLDHYLQQVEELFLRRAMELAQGNKAEAARLLGLNRPRFYRKLEQMEGTPAQPQRKPRPPRRERPLEEPLIADKEEIEFFPLDSSGEEESL